MAEKSNATKRLFWILGGLLILLVILGVVGRFTGILGGGGDATAVETAEADIRTITQVVTASGKVQPETEVIISPDVSGEIIDLPVREGDHVTRGVLLARIKPDFYLTQVEQAEAGVLQSRANMAQRQADLLKAEADLRRQRDLFAKNAISQSALEDAETQHEVAKAVLDAARYAVQSAEARLREAEEQVSKTAIYSPMDGTISKLDVELGERVVGTSQMAGTEMMRVARLDQMEVEVEVNENEIVHVALGDTAAIEVDAYPDRVFRGTVTEIANSARTTAAGTQEQVTEFPVKVRILDPHNADSASFDSQTFTSGEMPMPDADVARLRPGMSGTVDVFTETAFDVVAVPIQAVTVRDFNAMPNDDEEEEDGDGTNDPSRTLANVMNEDLRRVVFIVSDGAAKMVEVETGISNDTHIEVRSGLAGGEHVVIGPYRVVSRTLKDGDAISTDDRGGPPPFVATGS
ncbi:MAG: efflux RND transporter periplasmic adaptor subunit [Rhodothermales bacterium]